MAAATSIITEQSPYIVRTSFTAAQVIVPLAEWALKDGIKHVVTRIYDPLRSDTFTALGLEAISPTIIGANAFYEQLTGEPAAPLTV